MSDGLLQKLEARLSDLHAEVLDLKGRLSRKDWFTDPVPDPWGFRHELEGMHVADVLAKMKGVPVEKIGLEALKTTTMGEVAKYALSSATTTQTAHLRRPPIGDPPPIWWWFADPAPWDWTRDELDLNRDMLEQVALVRGVPVEKLTLEDVKSTHVGEVVARLNVARRIPKKPEIADPPNLREILESWWRSGLERIGAAEVARMDKAQLEGLQHQIRGELSRLQGLSKLVETQINELGGR